MIDSQRRLRDLLARAGGPAKAADRVQMAGVLFEHTLHPTLLTDNDGNVLLTNAAAHSLSEGREGPLGQPVLDLVAPAEREKLRVALDAWRRDGARDVLHGEHAPAGGARPDAILAWSVQALRDASDQPFAWLVVAQDVTEQVQLRRQLARTAALYHGMFDNATDPILVIDAHGIVRALSRSAEAMFGWPRAELIGQNVSVLMTEPHRSNHDGYLRRYLASGHSAVLGRLREFVVRRRDGTLLTCELSAFRIDVPDEALPVFCGFFRDASERKRVQTQEAAHLAALGTIAESASVLTHEIKNPITGLRHALRALAGQLGASEQEILGELVERLQRLERRLRRSLAFVRSPQLERERCDLGKLARDVAADLRQMADGRQVRVEVQAAPDVTADADAPLLQDLLGNLVMNALEALQPGGKVVIRVAPANGGLELRVDDDGPGIPPSVREMLFQPFVTSKAEGTGLGLMICQRIVEAHGGAIRTEPSALGGASFVVTLPSRR